MRNSACSDTGRLARLDDGVRKLAGKLAEPDVDRAIRDGRIPAAQRERWLERAGRDPAVVREVLSELPPDRRLAAANAPPAAITPAQEAALEEIFPGLVRRGA